MKEIINKSVMLTRYKVLFSDMLGESKTHIKVKPIIKWNNDEIRYFKIVPTGSNYFKRWLLK